MKIMCVLFFCVLCLPPAMSQNKNKKSAEELRALGREKLIDLATQRLRRQYPTFDPKDYERTDVFIEDESLYVEFDFGIRYVPQDSCLDFGFSVDLVQSSVSIFSHNSANDCRGGAGIFKLNQNARDQIALIQKHAALSVTRGIYYVIYDKGEYYLIDGRGNGWEHGYKLDKKSWKKSDEFDGMGIATKQIEIK